tara:strand:- start:32 stop:565 length:534 start_codon:yes stop_codon:yes gene_type:complete
MENINLNNNEKKLKNNKNELLIEEIKEFRLEQKFIDENILNLKIISKIKENDKLLTNKNLLEIDSPHIFQSINRWYNNESRTITIEKLNEILEGTFKITKILLEDEKKQNKISRTLEENNSQIFQTFILEMKNSLVGLENLKKTYSNDILISSQLDLLINKLNTKIEKMSKIFTIKI